VGAAAAAQLGLTLSLLEGGRARAADNHRLGELTLDWAAGAAAAAADVSLLVDEQGVISLSARLRGAPAAAEAQQTVVRLATAGLGEEAVADAIRPGPPGAVARP
jgi:hypothetical protein